MRLYVKINGEEQVVGNISKGLLKLVPKTLIQSGIDKYLKLCTSQNCLENQKNEKAYFVKFKEFCDKNELAHLSEITLDHMESLKSQYLKKMKDSSCSRRFAVYHAFFEDCIRWEFISVNPMKGLSKFKIEANPFKKWTKDEFELFIKTTDGSRKDLCMFLWYTGCRPKEAINLKWTDIDYNDLTITLRTLKNAKNGRKFFIEKYTDKLLHNIKQSSNFVFVLNNKPIVYDNFYQYVKHRLTKLGLKHLTPYGMRHAFAGRCEDDGVQLSHIQNMLGHSDIRTTMRYINPLEKEVRRSLKKVSI